MNVANRVYAQLDFAVSPDMYTFVITKKIVFQKVCKYLLFS